MTTEGAREERVKQPTMEWVRKSAMRLPTFDVQKEKETFLQARGDFTNTGASCSKAREQRNGTERIPLRSDPCITEFQHQARPYEENESMGIVKSFLQSCLKLLKDEKALSKI